ncbi:MAG: hypothetical protein VYD19_03195 [Myxococcota bacterium]|nr:hypothetical protein [Myxococcota bacterium]
MSPPKIDRSEEPRHYLADLPQRLEARATAFRYLDESWMALAQRLHHRSQELARGDELELLQDGESVLGIRWHGKIGRHLTLSLEIGDGRWWEAMSGEFFGLTLRADPLEAQSLIHDALPREILETLLPEGLEAERHLISYGRESPSPFFLALPLSFQGPGVEAKRLLGQLWQLRERAMSLVAEQLARELERRSAIEGELPLENFPSPRRREREEKLAVSPPRQTSLGERSEETRAESLHQLPTQTLQQPSQSDHAHQPRHRDTVTATIALAAERAMGGPLGAPGMASQQKTAASTLTPTPRVSVPPLPPPPSRRQTSAVPPDPTAEKMTTRENLLPLPPEPSPMELALSEGLSATQGRGYEAHERTINDPVLVPAETAEPAASAAQPGQNTQTEERLARLAEEEAGWRAREARVRALEAEREAAIQAFREETRGELETINAHPPLQGMRSEEGAEPISGEISQQPSAQISSHDGAHSTQSASGAAQSPVTPSQTSPVLVHHQPLTLPVGVEPESPSPRLSTEETKKLSLKGIDELESPLEGHAPSVRLEPLIAALERGGFKLRRVSGYQGGAGKILWLSNGVQVALSGEGKMAIRGGGGGAQAQVSALLERYLIALDEGSRQSS